MKRKKKSLALQFFVYLIIFALLFSVIGVVAIYLRGTQQTEQQRIEAQQALQDSFQVQDLVIGTSAVADVEADVALEGEQPEDAIEEVVEDILEA